MRASSKSSFSDGSVADPDLSAFVALIAESYDYKGIGCLGQRTASRCAALGSRFELIPIESGLEPPAAERAGRSLVVCVGDGSEKDLRRLLELGRTSLESSPLSIFAFPQAPGDRGQKSALTEAGIIDILHEHGLDILFSGLTASNNQDYAKETLLVVAEKAVEGSGALDIPPSGFQVVAILPVYNEEDILAASLTWLCEQGIKTYVLENWSTDRSHEIATQFLGKGVLKIERFPKEGPARYHDWKQMLRRIEEISQEVEADWFCLQDCDELYVSPWPGVGLRDAYYRVDRRGFNCINHTVLNFHPIDNGYTPGTDFGAYFKHYEFCGMTSHFQQLRGWKHLGPPVSLKESGGHEVKFAGRRVFPFRFLLKHYPIRSQAHGQKKVFVERKPRWSSERRAEGWHHQYDLCREEGSFLHSPDKLDVFQESNFNRNYLVERLTCIGILRNDWQRLLPSAAHRRGLLAQIEEKERAIVILSERLAEREREILACRTEAGQHAEELTVLRAALAERAEVLQQLASLPAWQLLRRYVRDKNPVLRSLVRRLLPGGNHPTSHR